MSDEYQEFLFASNKDVREEIEKLKDRIAAALHEADEWKAKADKWERMAMCLAEKVGKLAPYPLPVDVVLGVAEMEVKNHLGGTQAGKAGTPAPADFGEDFWCGT
jgi:hypothetical protein